MPKQVLATFWFFLLPVSLTDTVTPLSSAFSRSNCSTAITATTGRPRLATIIGPAGARSICRPKPYFASFALSSLVRAAHYLFDVITQSIHSERGRFLVLLKIFPVPA